MRRLLAFAVPAVLLLAAPASALAKGIVAASVCGADGCRTISEPDHDLLGGGATTDAPSRPEPFVRLNVEVGVPGNVERMRMLYLPRSDRLLAPDGTTWLQPLALATLRAVARRVTPFAASELPASVRLAGSEAARAGEPLPPEVVGGVAADPPPARSDDGGVKAWWLVVPAAAIGLAAGAVLVRRRRRDPPATTAGAMG